MTVRINKQKINLREKLAGIEDKVNFDEVVRGLGEYTGNVGIGVTSPDRKFQVKNNGATNSYAFQVLGGNTDGNRIAGIMDIYVASTDRSAGALALNESDSTTSVFLSAYPNQDSYINNGGNVGIGTEAPISSAKLEVQGDSNGTAGIGMRHTGAAAGNLWRMYMRGNSDLVISNPVSVGVKLEYSQTSWSAESDESLKDNISELGLVLDKVKNYRCINYSLISNEMTEANAVGFIAQDWESDFPNIVSSDEDGKLSMKYTETIPVLLKAIQEQQQLIEQLKSQNESQQSTIDSLVSRIENLENK